MTRILSARRMAWALAAIILFASMPIISVMTAMGVASLAACHLNEATTLPCVILGIDFGGLLTFMLVAGWLALATVPLGVGALLIWVLIAIVLFVRSRSRRMG